MSPAKLWRNHHSQLTTYSPYSLPHPTHSVHRTLTALAAILLRSPLDLLAVVPHDNQSTAGCHRHPSISLLAFCPIHDRRPSGHFSTSLYGVPRPVLTKCFLHAHPALPYLLFSYPLVPCLPYPACLPCLPYLHRRLPHVYCAVYLPLLQPAAATVFHKKQPSQINYFGRPFRKSDPQNKSWPAFTPVELT